MFAAAGGGGGVGGGPVGAVQPGDYPPNAAGYAGYNPTAYHYANPYLNASTAAVVASSGYPLSVAGGDYGSSGSPFGMPPPQHHMVQDLNKLGKDG